MTLISKTNRNDQINIERAFGSGEKNLQSTKFPYIGTATTKNDIQKDAFPDQINTKLHFFNIILDMVKEATTYTDLTGQFQYQSSRRNNYVFVA